MRSYVALRKAGLTKEEAFEALGVYCGDDSLDRDINGVRTHHELESKAWGLEYKVHTSKRGEPVPYLGRFFCDPWNQSFDSICDPLRTMVKIHMTAKSTLSPAQLAFNKATGLLGSDAKTPVVSHFCKAMLRCSGLAETKALSWDDQYKISNSYPQESEDLIRDTFSFVCPDISAITIKGFVGECEKAKSLDKLPRCFFDSSRKIKWEREASTKDITFGPAQPKIDAAVRFATQNIAAKAIQRAGPRKSKSTSSPNASQDAPKSQERRPPGNPQGQAKSHCPRPKRGPGDNR
jgi:hypothetical protein